MDLDLFGKWYVYRYSLDLTDPEASLNHPRLLKADETTLEISQQTESGCLARFELSGWSEPVEIEMIAGADDSWFSNQAGSFDFLKFRWARVELDAEKPAVLMGHVIDKNHPEALRDFFVAVRSRRTHGLPEETIYQFGPAFYTPFDENEPLETWGQSISVDPVNDLILIDTITYNIDSKQHHQGGLVLTAQLDPQAGDEPEHALALWILPVAEPEEPGDLLAVGFYNAHLAFNSGSADPECQGATGTGGKPN